MSPVSQELVDRQNAASARFESSRARVNMKLFQSAAAPPNKYTVKYKENVTAIENLVSRTRIYKMKTSIHQDGQPLTKTELWLDIGLPLAALMRALISITGIRLSHVISILSLEKKS